MSKEKAESYYKILGTTAKISNRRIKEKYIQAVKKHPPETDPEGFEKVRRAYETLKDPEKRKQYDLMRKYGTNVEELMDKAYDAMDQMNFDKAENSLEKAAKIAPENESVAIAQMTFAIMTDDLTKGETLFEKALRLVPDNEEKASLYLLKGTMLHQHEYEDEALETLEQAIDRLPDEKRRFAIPAATIYMQMGYDQEAWKMIDSAIPVPDEENFKDIYLFITWVNIMASAAKWDSMSKVQTRFRKFLKKLTDKEELEQADELLHDTFLSAYDSGDFRIAAFFGDLLKVINETDKDFRDELNEAKKLAPLQKQLTRLEHDESMFPLIYIDAFMWFYEEYMPEEQYSMMVDSLPQDMIDDLKAETEEYAAGIVRLQKKYPMLYKGFKEKWDELFTELTKDFNREMKRELRKVK